LRYPTTGRLDEDGLPVGEARPSVRLKVISSFGPPTSKYAGRETKMSNALTNDGIVSV